MTVLLALIASAQAGGGQPAACDASASIDVAGIQRRLHAAEALWKRVGAKQYRLKTTVEGEVGRYTVDLSVGRVVVSELTIMDSAQVPGHLVNPPVSRPESASGASRYTVPGLFSQVQRLLDATSPARSCGTLKVAFDPVDGHLRSLQYDNAFSEDEEFSLNVSPVTGTP